MKTFEEMNEIEIEAQKKQTEKTRQSAMTVQELYNKLGEIIKNGDGDAMIDVDDNFGGSYMLSKNTKLTVSKVHEEVFGKWLFLGF